MSGRASRVLPFRPCASKPVLGSPLAVPHALSKTSSSKKSSSAPTAGGGRTSRTLPPSSPARVRGGRQGPDARGRRAQQVQRVLKKAKASMPPRSGGVLRRLAVTTPVAWSYRRVLDEFFAFVISWSLVEPLDLPRQAEALDLAASEWCDHLYMEGHPVYIGERLYAALQDSYTCLNAAGSVKLPELYRTRQAWRRRAPGRSRAPLALTQVLLIVDWFLSQRQVEMSLWILVCFTTYYRPSEVFSLRVGDLLRPTARLPNFALQLHPGEGGVSSKARIFDDGVPLDSPVMKWLPAALIKVLRLRTRKPDELMFQFTYQELLIQFKAACRDLGFDDPSLYRLRHGGASHDAASRLRSIVEIKRRGRWASDASVRRYEKGTWLQSVEVKVSPTQASKAMAVEDALPQRLGVSKRG